MANKREPHITIYKWAATVPMDAEFTYITIELPAECLKVETRRQLEHGAGFANRAHVRP